MPSLARRDGKLGRRDLAEREAVRRFGQRGEGGGVDQRLEVLEIGVAFHIAAVGFGLTADEPTAGVGLLDVDGGAEGEHRFGLDRLALALPLRAEAPFDNVVVLRVHPFRRQRRGDGFDLLEGVGFVAVHRGEPDRQGGDGDEETCDRRETPGHGETSKWRAGATTPADIVSQAGGTGNARAPRSGEQKRRSVSPWRSPLPPICSLNRTHSHSICEVTLSPREHSNAICIKGAMRGVSRRVHGPPQRCAGSLAQTSGGSVAAIAGPLTPNPVAPGQTASAELGDGDAAHVQSVLPAVRPNLELDAERNRSRTGRRQPAGPVVARGHLDSRHHHTGRRTFTATATATWTDTCGDVFVASGAAGPITITVDGVGVQNLQYLQPGSGFVDVTGTLYVLVGQSVTFQAVATPAGSTFPQGQPVWSGTSGASGTGDPITVTFNQLSASTSDYQTVTATCGNSSATADVIVYDLTPVLTPEDNFDGRDLTTYGVCENVDLSYQTTPSGINDSDIGGLQWVITSGGGTLSGGTGGISVYRCPATAATVVLSLLITGGPMLGLMKNADPKDVVPPDGVLVQQQPGTDLWHVKDTCSCGFCGDVYATCGKTVSFKQIVLREGGGVSVATGYYKDNGLDGLVGHLLWTWP